MTEGWKHSVMTIHLLKWELLTFLTYMVCPVFLTRRAIHTTTLYNETIRMYFLLIVLIVLFRSLCGWYWRWSCTICDHATSSYGQKGITGKKHISLYYFMWLILNLFLQINNISVFGSCDHSDESYWAVLSCWLSMLHPQCAASIIFLSIKIMLRCDHSNENNTVKPLLRGHLRDLPKCPLNRGL